MEATTHPHLFEVVRHITKISPFQKKAVLRLVAEADKRYLDFADNLIVRLLNVVGRQDDYEYLAKTYLWYTKTIRIEEIHFSKENQYRYSKYDEVYERVYGRDDYMLDYVIGLGMTQMFWPNHYAIVKFFQNEFLPLVENFNTGAEVGVGHGIFHSEFLKACPHMRSILLDVSQTSLDITLKMIEATGLDSKRTASIKVDVQKEIPLADCSLDALLMGELIEHIEHGAEVMSNFTKKLKPTGYCYFSTAANSPAEDHILLFKTTGEIRNFLDNNGWKIIKEYLGTLNNMRVEDAEQGRHNINYAAVLAIKI